MAIYHPEAGIASMHAHAASFSETNWRAIIAFYDELQQMSPSPVVLFNRAIAVAQLHGAAAGLRALDAVEDMAGSHLYHAARGDLLRGMGRKADAIAAYEVAVSLTRSPAEEVLLRKKLAACE